MRLRLQVQSLPWKTLGVFAAGAILAAGAGLAGWEALHYSSTTSFCLSCHEMRVVGEQGWRFSPHYQNRKGIIAGCSDCHVPPENELVSMLWVKARDGSKDVWVHLFGEADPRRMNWEELGKSARAKIKDSSCERCHANLFARGLPLKAIMAHRERGRIENALQPKPCLSCHTREFHPGFKSFLFPARFAAREGGEK